MFKYLEMYILNSPANWKPMGNPVPVLSINAVKEQSTKIKIIVLIWNTGLFKNVKNC